MYHIYVNEQMVQSVENINQISAIIEQSLQSDSTAWICIKQIDSVDPLPALLLPLLLPFPSVEHTTSPQIQALTPADIIDTLK